jgi:hypothetical protein
VDPISQLLTAGEVPAGATLGWSVYVDGEDVWLSVQDDMGAVMVKRYRLVTRRGPADS